MKYLLLGGKKIGNHRLAFIYRNQENCHQEIYNLFIEINKIATCTPTKVQIREVLVVASGFWQLLLNRHIGVTYICICMCIWCVWLRLTVLVFDVFGWDGLYLHLHLYLMFLVEMDANTALVFFLFHLIYCVHFLAFAI